MLVINGRKFYTNNQGYTVTLSPVNSQNEGVNCDGTQIWTEIGKRPVITITTNMMTEKEYSELFRILYGNTTYTIQYPIPYKEGYGKQDFRLQGDINTIYYNMLHKKISSTTITFSAVEAKIIEG